jgi:hypothetical protein
MSSTVDLDSLKAEIESIGNQIKTAKSEKATKDVIEPLVAQLLEKKQLYATNNGGIGVDGKPFGGSSGSGAKKEQSKAPAAAAQEQAVNPDNEKKKAAKKAEKAAKKAAHKAAGGGGGGASPPAPAAGGGKPAGAPPAAAKAPAPAATTTTATAKPASIPSNYNVSPLQLVINPNAPITLLERPCMALATAILTNTDVDLNISLEPRISHAMLGLEDGSGTIVGDLAMARYLYSRAAKLVSYNTTQNSLLCSISDQAQQDAWMEYAQSLSLLSEEQRFKGIAMTLEHTLQTKTYVCGHKLSMADLALFAVLGWPTTLDFSPSEATKALAEYPAASRWLKMMSSHPAIQKATQLASGDAKEVVFNSDEVLDPLVPGMNLLEGAIPGRVVTRFPPEPSGYLVRDTFVVFCSLVFTGFVQPSLTLTTEMIDCEFSHPPPSADNSTLVMPRRYC